MIFHFLPLTIKIPGITFEAFPVVHSLNAPAVGYRVTAGAVKGAATIFYVPDLISIVRRKKALKSVAQSYIQQANAILEDLANRLMEAIEAGKINLQTEPVIKLT